MRLPCQILMCLVVAAADSNYEDKYTKIWSIASASESNGPRTAVVNVTSASILIQPTPYSAPSSSFRNSRDSKLPGEYKQYAFKPRSLPLRRNIEQVAPNVYYSHDNENYKQEVLFPGNYLNIAEEKSNDSNSEDKQTSFHPKAIPLLRDPGEGRSLVDDDKVEDYSAPVASRRSISDILGGVEDEVEDDDDGDDEYEIDDDEYEASKGHKKRKKQKKAKKPKLGKFMMPLLLAYKMKYIALVPVMMGGLILLVGATGLAGFFFALFAAVMGLQKGAY